MGSAMTESVKCSLCSNQMEFGLASPSMLATRSEAEMVETMAILTGWYRENNAWVCGRHDAAQAMSAGTAKTEGLGGDSPASAVRQDAPETPLSTPLPSGSIER